jgi:hypothetical protein
MDIPTSNTVIESQKSSNNVGIKRNQGDSRRRNFTANFRSANLLSFGLPNLAVEESFPNPTDQR